MSNPSPTQSPSFLAEQGKPRYAVLLASPIGVRFPIAVALLLYRLPNKAEFIRQAVSEKFERDSAVEAIATHPARVSE